MRLLITFGDSFTYGLQEEEDKCLEYSFGSHLSKYLGFDKYINYAFPSWGNETVWKNFLNLNPRQTFGKYDVYCVFISSYFTRLTVPIDDYYNTLSYNTKDKNIMKEWVLENKTPIETLNNYSCDTLKEILQTFNDWNWNWVLGFNNIIDQNIFLKKYNKFDKIKLIPPTFSKGMYHGSPKEYHCKVTDHLNKYGYECVANSVFEWVMETHSSWKGNSNPIKTNYEIKNHISDENILFTNRPPL